MIGGAVFGQLGDKFGRKPILLICLYLHIALAVGVYFSQSYEVFAALRFFVGFFLQVRSYHLGIKFLETIYDQF